MIPMWQLVLGISVGLVTLFLTSQRRAIAHGEAPPHRSGSCGGESNRNHSGRSRGAANSSARFNSQPGDLCVICLMAMHNDDMTYMQCGHALHEQCYQSCRRHTKVCPVCRTRM